MERVENDKIESAEFVLTAVQMLGSKELMLRAAKSLSLKKDFDTESRKSDGAPSSLSRRLADALGDRVKARLRRLTRLIDVTAEDSDPKRAQIIAETVATEFLKQSYEQNAQLSHGRT